MTVLVIQKFTILLLYCAISCYYLPGIDKLLPWGGKIPWFLMWAIIGYINTIVNTVDWGILLANPLLSFDSKMYTIFSMGCHFYNCLKAMYFFINRTRLEEIFWFWENILTCKETMKDFLKSVQMRNLKSLLIAFCTLVFPFVLTAVQKIYSRTLFIPSNFNSNVTQLNAPLLLCIHQTVCSCAFASGYVSYYLLMSLIMDLTITELEFLKTELTSICDGIAANCDSSKGINSEKELKQLNERLSKWIKYHGNVMKFNKMVKDLWGPIIISDYIFKTITLCGLVFCNSKGYTNEDAILLCQLVVVVLMGMMYSVVRFVDRLEEVSSKLYEVALNNWALYPQNIKKALILVCMQSQKCMTMDFHSYLPLTSQTFQAMCVLQYKVITFMKNMG